jgi:hypothetical protein
MLSAVSDQLPSLLRDLAVAGIVGFIYLTAKAATERRGMRLVLLKGFMWCAGLALLAAVLKGQGTCVGGDPLFGYCDERLGGYVPSMTSRVATFAYWFLLLMTPVAAGAFNDRSRLRFMAGGAAKDRA